MYTNISKYMHILLTVFFQTCNIYEMECIMANTIVNIPDIVWKDTNTMFNYKFLQSKELKLL